MIVTDSSALDDFADRDLLEDALRRSASLIGVGGDHSRAESELVDELLRVAWFNQYQLRVLVSLVESVQPTAETVQSVVDGARNLGIAPSSAIGAAASLVGLVREGDEEETARFLATALHHFSDEELRAASASLATSLTLMIAETMNLSPRLVHLEMVDACVGEPKPLPEPESAPADRAGRRPVRRTHRRASYGRCATLRSLAAG